MVSNHEKLVEIRIGQMQISIQTRQVPSCPYGLCDVVSQRPKGAYSARLVGQNVYREIERETVGTVSNIEKKWTPEYR